MTARPRRTGAFTIPGSSQNLRGQEDVEADVETDMEDG
jgi:hypothetical protein